MVDVDKLTDAELRTKLMEYGFPSLPITGTTRKVMVKKLKLLVGTKPTPKADGRRSLGKYSSEDDSDSELKTAKSKRRVTMAAPPMQPPPALKPTLKKTTRIVETTIEEDIPKKESRATTSVGVTRSSRIMQRASDEFDTGSDSESEFRQNSHHVSSESDSKTGYRQGSSFTSSPTIDLRDSPKKSLDTSYSRAFSSSSDRPAAFSSPVLGDGASERLNQIRSRLSLGTSGLDRASSYSAQTTSTVGSTVEKADTPFLSNFTRRLSQLSASKSNDYTYRNDGIKEHDTNGATVYPRTSQYTNFRSTVRPREYQYDYTKTNRNGNLLKDNLVPFTVLGVAVLFFIFVGFIYLGMRSDTSLEQHGYKVPYCNSSNLNHTRGVNCVLEREVENAMKLLKPLGTELKERGIKRVCEDSKISDRMDDNDVVGFVKEKFSFQDERRILTDLHNLQVLILRNPSWGISIIQAGPDEEITEKNIVKNLDNLGFERVTKPISLIVLKPNIPWSCSLANKIFSIFKTVLILITFFGVVYGSNVGYKHYTNYQKKQRNEVICLVERILEVLQSGAGNEGENNYVVINHVRDMIIPVTERRAKDKMWKQAVEFINENESRVRTETQVVQGEEYYVWRWVGSNNLSLNAKNKSWQGQAFETQTGAVNSLPCSPTPCLKIRGMVEDGDRNTQLIREAVLSKCAPKCRILHCAVDTLMKCVYLKCEDTSDAAVAYQNLHGWWFAGQLVTVKYLRLERYMQRFPDSPMTGPPYLRATLPASDGWAS